jgi:hypothetical protein
LLRRPQESVLRGVLHRASRPVTRSRDRSAHRIARSLLRRAGLLASEWSQAIDRNRLTARKSCAALLYGCDWSRAMAGAGRTANRGGGPLDVQSDFSGELPDQEFGGRFATDANAPGFRDPELWDRISMLARDVWETDGVLHYVQNFMARVDGAHGRLVGQLEGLSTYLSAFVGNGMTIYKMQESLIATAGRRNWKDPRQDPEWISYVSAFNGFRVTCSSSAIYRDEWRVIANPQVEDTTNAEVPRADTALTGTNDTERVRGRFKEYVEL